MVAGFAAFAQEPFTVLQEAFDPKGSHIQGIAASQEALYLSQDCRIVKVDWAGKEIAHIDTPVHTGDICWYEGELYVSLALPTEAGGPMSDPTSGVGKIQVFDPALNLVREAWVDRRTDGIAALNGVLYVGMGSATQPSKMPHRRNVLGRFDARTLEEIAPRAEFDYGYETKYGFQNIVVSE